MATTICSNRGDFFAVFKQVLILYIFSIYFLTDSNKNLEQ